MSSWWLTTICISSPRASNAFCWVWWTQCYHFLHITKDSTFSYGHICLLRLNGWILTRQWHSDHSNSSHEYCFFPRLFYYFLSRSYHRWHFGLHVSFSFSVYYGAFVNITGFFILDSILDHTSLCNCQNNFRHHCSSPGTHNCPQLWGKVLEIRNFIFYQFGTRKRKFF